MGGIDPAASEWPCRIDSASIHNPSVSKTAPNRRHAATTLLDVALAAGVSRTTASAALGGTGRISDATRERVRSVAGAPDAVFSAVFDSSTWYRGLYLWKLVSDIESIAWLTLARSVEPARSTAS